MKADIHPEYREVLFHDSGADKYFLIPSTLETSETREYEGKTYPIILLIFHLHLILFTQALKGLLIPVVVFKDLKKVWKEINFLTNPELPNPFSLFLIL